MIVTDGRTDIADLFKLSPLLHTKLKHTPFLAFVVDGSDVHVKIIDAVDELLLLSDETPVMAQWRGEWRSDFFQFTVGDVRNAVEQGGGLKSNGRLKFAT